MNEIEARGKIKYRIANEMRKYGENKEEYEDLEIAIQALKEIREYRAMEERLNGISVKQVVDGFIKQVENETQEEYKQGRILTNKEAEDWNIYRELGTVEELKALKEKNTPMELAEHNFQDEVHHYLCPSCRNIVSFNQNYCEECVQALET